jgi:hypothetical protein
VCGVDWTDPVVRNQTTVDESIKEYLRRIGAKGGKAVAGTPQAKARAAKAAKARWTKRKQKKSEKS